MSQPNRDARFMKPAHLLPALAISRLLDRCVVAASSSSAGSSISWQMNHVLTVVVAAPEPARRPWRVTEAGARGAVGVVQ